MITTAFAPEPSEPDDLSRQLKQIPKRSRSPLYGGARRASSTDLEGYFSRVRNGPIASFENVLLTLEDSVTRSIELAGPKNLYLPEAIRERNILVFGPIGSGKTQRFMYPAMNAGIKDTNASNFIITTKDGDTRFIRSLVERHCPETEVVVLNLADRKRSNATWLPFPVESNNDTDLLNAIQTYIRACHVSTDRIDSFWDGTSSRIIAGICQRLQQKFPDRWSPAEILQILELPRPQLLGFLKEGAPVQFALSSAAFIESGAHNAETCLAFAQSYMRCFADEGIAAVTASSGFNYVDLFYDPTVVILEVPLRIQQRIRPLLNLFVSQLLRKATEFASEERDNRLSHPLNIFLDDFPLTTGRIEEFPEQLNLVRSIGVRIFAAAHGIGSIRHFFGTEAPLVLSGFSTKIFMSAVELSDAEWASSNSGAATVDCSSECDETEPSIKSRFSFLGREPRPVARKLLMPDDVKLAPKHPSLGRASTVFLADEHVFQGWFVPAYQQPKLSGVLAQIAPGSSDCVSDYEIPCWKPLIKASVTEAKRPELSAEGIRERHEELKKQLFTEDDSQEARDYWASIEKEFLAKRPVVCMSLAEELVRRKSTIAEFRKAMLSSGTTNFQATLHYLDYSRLRDSDG